MALGTFTGWPSDGFTIDDLLDDDIYTDEPPCEDEIDMHGWLFSCTSIFPSRDDLVVVEAAIERSGVSCVSEATSAWQNTRATKAIYNFCQRRAGGCVVPNTEELDSLWFVAAAAGASAIAAALRGQLSPPSGGAVGGFWAPRLRALHALEHFWWQGGKGAEAFCLVLAKAGSQLNRLALQVPQCSRQAKRVLAMKELGSAKALSL